MTDAQSFYLLLAAFYLWECLSFAPGGAQAFISQGRHASRWRWRNLAFRFSGTNKDVFCAPIIPWPRMLVVFSPSQNTDTTPSPLALRHLRKRAALLDRITRPLRRLSLVLFLHYFLILPLCYYFLTGTIWVLIAILVGELLAMSTACRFYRLHRRLYPDLKGERRLETFYNAFFPWHSMRASDHFIAKASQQWHPLTCLASHREATPNLRELSRLWRKATHQGDTSQLSSILAQTDIDPTPWNAPPDHEPGQQFCPLCQTIYEAGPTHCADCDNVTLKTT